MEICMYICGSIVLISLIFAVDDIINTYMNNKHELDMAKFKDAEENK